MINRFAEGLHRSDRLIAAALALLLFPLVAHGSQSAGLLTAAMSQMVLGHNPYPSGFEESTIFSGLTLPVAVRFATDGRAFVAEKDGIVKAFDSVADTTPTVVANLSSKLWNFHDHGLLGLAVDPQWPTRPYIYVFYAMRGAPGGHISRLQVDPATNQMVGTEVVLVENWCLIYASHGVGDLNFGPDGALYASAGDGASFNFVDWGQEEPHNEDENPAGPCTCNDPPMEGGTLRSQDIRTTGDTLRYNGAVIRIDPDTGAAFPDNPLIGGSTADDRIIAAGLRNPFRFTVDPATGALYICDVGWNTWEEINRIADPTQGPISNFGWPCYEGPAVQGAYYYSDIPICNGLYAENTAVAPFYTYQHVNGASTTGAAVYQGGSYPAKYNHALFFADYSLHVIRAMLPNAYGVPDPDLVESFADSEVNPVDLQVGPNGDLFYVDIINGAVRRIQYVGSLQAPDAIATADVTSGPSPLTVQFSGASSEDFNGGPLTYGWDFNNDGDYSDSTVVEPVYTFQTSGTYPVNLKVTTENNISAIDTVVIAVDNGYPVATITQPLSGATWRVGDSISFAGSANDPDTGAMAADTLTWDAILDHCVSLNPPNCHQHHMHTFAGVASGSLTTIDHEFPCQIELSLTATEPGLGGLSNTTTLLLVPEVSTLTLTTSPANLQAGIYAELGATPLTRQAIINGITSITAPSPQFGTGIKYTFQSWSDSGAVTHNITIPATDTTYTATFASNRQPVLAAIGNKTVDENVQLQFTVTATDPDGTTPVLSAANLPSGANFTNNGNGTGTFTWTPTYSQAGTYSNVSFKAADATDALWWDTKTITITVTNVNRPPTVSAGGNKSVNENAQLQFTVTGTDPDGTTPTLGAANLPSGASFVDNGNGTGTFTWTPGYTQSGTYANVQFTAADASLSGSTTITITVNNVNRAPAVSAITNKTVNENQALQFSVSATDPDGQTPSLSGGNLPQGATLVDNGNGTGTFSWTPNYSDAGTYANVSVIANDGDTSPLTGTATFSVTVNNVNRAPELGALSDKAVNENALLTFNVSATDPDGGHPDFSASNLPSGASFVDNGNGTGTFSWTPNYSAAGVYSNITFVATDNDSSPISDTGAITITVNNVNRSPVLNPIGQQSVAENETLEISATASDPDGTTPTLNVLNLPDGATFTDNGNGTGVFLWTPSFTQAGDYSVTFVAADAENVSDTVQRVVGISVSNVNRKPVLAPLTDVTATESDTVAFQVSASDPDGDAIQLTAENLPAGAQFVDHGDGTAAFSWQTDFASAANSPYVITFNATDGDRADSIPCTVTINNLNRPVTLNPIGAKKGSEGKTMSFNVRATDPDGTPQILATNVPDGATIAQVKAGVVSFVWTPDYQAAAHSPYEVTFTATDGESEKSETVTITIKDATAPGTINVTKPKGGVVWPILSPEKFKIKWKSFGATGDTVAIELWRDGVFVRNIKKSTANDGGLAWEVDGTYAPLSGYSIRVRSNSNPLIYGESSGTFTLQGPGK